MNRAIAFVYDTDERKLDGSIVLLRKYAVESAGFRLEPHSNRVAFLKAIAEASPTPSIALIDLVVGRRLDHEYPGHRLIEVIRRNGTLSGLCRPVALTAHPYEQTDGYRRVGVTRQVEQSGGYGLIDRTALENEHPAVGQLAEALIGLVGMRARSWAEHPLPSFLRLPEISVSEPARPKRDRDWWVPWFTQDPKLSSRDEAILRYLASECDPSSIAQWLVDDQPLDWLTATERACHRSDDLPEALRTKLRRRVLERIDRLGTLATVPYRVRGRSLETLAKDVVHAVPELMAPLDDKAQVRTLHRVQEIKDLIQDDRLLKTSWLDSEALGAVRTVIAHEEAWMERIPPRAGQAPRVTTLLEAIGQASGGEETDRIQRAVVRGVNGLYETWMALQERDQQDRAPYDAHSR